MEVIINPGTGPVMGSEESAAIENMRHFATDCKQKGLRFVRTPEIDYGDGRFAFLLWMEDGQRCHEIQMPGLPLERVRYMDNEGQDIWAFPRLYVDGSSFVWKFAILDHPSEWNDNFEQE